MTEKILIEHAPTVKDYQLKEIDLDHWQKFVDFLVDDMIPTVNTRIVNTHLEDFQGLMNDYLHNVTVGNQRLTELKESRKLVDRLKKSLETTKTQLNEAQGKLRKQEGN